jgi:hypothetical protein
LITIGGADSRHRKTRFDEAWRASYLALCGAAKLRFPAPSAPSAQGVDAMSTTTRKLPYGASPLAHLCLLVSDALRVPALGASTEGEPAAPKRTWLERLDAWAWRERQKDHEAYLAQSSDLADLEARLRALERGARYY